MEIEGQRGKETQTNNRTDLSEALVQSRLHAMVCFNVNSTKRTTSAAPLLQAINLA